MLVDPRFFRIVSGIKVFDLAAHLGASITSGDREQVITGVAPMAIAGRGEVTFQSARPSADTSHAAGVIIITTADLAVQLAKITQLESERTILLVDHPRRSFASAVDMIVKVVEPGVRKTSIDHLAQIHPTASVGDGVVTAQLDGSLHRIALSGFGIDHGMCIGIDKLGLKTDPCPISQYDALSTNQLHITAQGRHIPHLTIGTRRHTELAVLSHMTVALKYQGPAY